MRGSIFSFLLPWEKIQKDVEAALVQGDLSQWPMDPVQVAQVIRVKFMQGPEEILNKFKEVKVRAKVMKDVALAYVANHCKDLCGSPGVLRIHGAGINRIDILRKVSASSQRKGIRCESTRSQGHN